MNDEELTKKIVLPLQGPAKVVGPTKNTYPEGTTKCPVP